MSAEHETAYPRLKFDPTETELAKIYTPSSDELEFARRHSNSQPECLALLIHLKIVQRLGYFSKSSEIPTIIPSHIAGHAHLKGVGKTKLRELDRTDARHRLRKLVRTRLNITAFEAGGAEVVARAAATAAQTMQELTDIINVVIEELVRQRFELPGFSTLQRAARFARTNANTSIYEAIADPLSAETKRAMDRLFTVDTGASDSGWQCLKRAAC